MSDTATYKSSKGRILFLHSEGAQLLERLYERFQVGFYITALLGHIDYIDIEKFFRYDDSVEPEAYFK